MIIPKNLHTSNQNLSENEQKEREVEASADKLRHRSCLIPTKPLPVNKWLVVLNLKGLLEA